MKEPANSQANANRPAGHPAVAAGRIGVLIANLGTPDATDFWSMRRYLKEFLSDKRVIEENTLIWKLVFHGIILTLRPRRKGRDYDTIWNRDKNESPLKTITRSQAEKLAAALASDSRIVVDWGMRYGNPSIASRIDALAAAGCERILFVPLYPQYAAATSATACDAVFRHLMTCAGSRRCASRRPITTIRSISMRSRNRCRRRCRSCRSSRT